MWSNIRFSLLNWRYGISCTRIWKRASHIFFPLSRWAQEHDKYDGKKNAISWLFFNVCFFFFWKLLWLFSHLAVCAIIGCVSFCCHRAAPNARAIHVNAFDRRCHFTCIKMWAKKKIHKQCAAMKNMNINVETTYRSNSFRRHTKKNNDFENSLLFRRCFYVLCAHQFNLISSNHF